MDITLLEKIKTSLRISHDKLDEDIQADIEACLEDLKVCGVVFAEPSNTLIFSAVKLYCRASYTDDPVKSAEWMRRYEKQKACLMMAEGYSWEEGSNE